MRSLALLLPLLSLAEGRKVTIGLISFNTGGRLADRTAGDGSGHCDPLWFTGQDQCDVAMSLCIELVGQASPNASICNTGWKSLGKLPMNQDLLSFQQDSVYGDWANPSTIAVPGQDFLGFVVKVKANDIDLGNKSQLIDAYAYQMTNSSDLLCTPTPVITQSVPLGNERTYRHSRPGAASCGGVSQCPTALTLAWAGAECGKCTPCHNGGTATITCKCICQHGFTGAACETIMCQHGGSPNGTSCACPPPFTGQFCENLQTARTCRDHYVAMQLEGAPFPVLEAASGVYTINPAGTNISVYCDMSTSPGGWTVIQRREKDSAPSVDFNATWNEYKSTIGVVGTTTHYLGNEPIHALTNIPGMPMALRVAVRECNDSSLTAPYFTYHSFQISNEAGNYTLNVSTSNATNSDGGAGDSLNDVFQTPGVPNNGQPFATYDRPEHGLPSFLGTCAGDSGGGWWYGTGCGSGNLNSQYYADCDAPSSYGIRWAKLNIKASYSMAYTVMKIIPQSVLPTFS